jgi:hypothetical protein
MCAGPIVLYQLDVCWTNFKACALKGQHSTGGRECNLHPYSERNSKAIPQFSHGTRLYAPLPSSSSSSSS